MLPMRSIVLSKSKPLNISLLKCRFNRSVAQRLRMVVTHVLARCDKEPAGAARGIADDVGGGGCHHLHHQLDDVARGAELPVLSGRGDLREHVLVDVALGVAVDHGDLVEPVDRLPQQRRRSGW